MNNRPSTQARPRRSLVLALTLATGAASWATTPPTTPRTSFDPSPSNLAETGSPLLAPALPSQWASPSPAQPLSLFEDVRPWLTLPSSSSPGAGKVQEDTVQNLDTAGPRVEPDGTRGFASSPGQFFRSGLFASPSGSPWKLGHQASPPRPQPAGQPQSHSLPQPKSCGNGEIFISKATPPANQAQAEPGGHGQAILANPCPASHPPQPGSRGPGQVHPTRGVRTYSLALAGIPGHGEAARLFAPGADLPPLPPTRPTAPITGRIATPALPPPRSPCLAHLPRLLAQAIGETHLGPMIHEHLTVWGRRAALSARTMVDSRQFLVLVDLDVVRGTSRGPALLQVEPLGHNLVTGLHLMQHPLLLCTLADGSYQFHHCENLGLLDRGWCSPGPAQAGTQELSPLLLAGRSAQDPQVVMGRGQKGLGIWDLTRGLGAAPVVAGQPRVTLSSIVWPEDHLLTATGLGGEVLLFDPRTGLRDHSLEVPANTVPLLTHAHGAGAQVFLGYENGYLGRVDLRQPATLADGQWDGLVASIRQLETNEALEVMVSAGESTFNLYHFGDTVNGLVRNGSPVPSRPAPVEVGFASGNEIVALSRDGQLSLNQLVRRDEGCQP